MVANARSVEDQVNLSGSGSDIDGRGSDGKSKRIGDHRGG